MEMDTKTRAKKIVDAMPYALTDYWDFVTSQLDEAVRDAYLEAVSDNSRRVQIRLGFKEGFASARGEGGARSVVF